jgi:hypothetical protein
MNTIKRLLFWIIIWFRRTFFAVPVVIEREVPLPPPPPPVTTIQRPARWVKPKGEKPKIEKKPPAEPKPVREPRPKVPRPALRTDDDPEQWGQYYFRDAILDQLATYFVYLKRMKKKDFDAYELHRKLGIHIMPRSAVQSFDKWRKDQGEDELSAWWKSNRPAFGAVSYGLDAGSIEEESLWVADLSPEQWQQGKLKHADVKLFAGQDRMATITKGPGFELPDGHKYNVGMIWVPKFLYFNKWSRVPSNIEKVVDGDVYTMTIYWDRVSGHSRGYHKRHKSGHPQEYAVCVERGTGKVRILRTLISETIKIASKKEVGGSFKIPHRHWAYATEYVSGACGRTDMSPEDYLRRCFMEAALMYESASLGSMVRITATKGRLTAAFGVDVKRMSYFFKDRDVVLNSKGSTARIFHIVRPHVRSNGKAVPMHFRGLREFEWAGHKIAITVPGRDHFPLAEFDVGAVGDGKKVDMRKMLVGGQIADRLNSHIKDGVGAWHPK